MPHSEISGSPGARPSPELFAACHVLHRLSVPRHPPDALLVLRHAQPQSRVSENRGQRSEDRHGAADATCADITWVWLLLPAHRSLGLGADASASPLPGPPVLAYCIPMPGHDRSTAESQGAPVIHPVMPASRSRLASRRQNVHGHHHRRCTELVLSEPAGADPGPSHEETRSRHAAPGKLGGPGPI